MGKYENMMKCAQVRSLANEKQYRNAYDVVQTLNIDQITAITDLNTIADVYIQLQKYEEAKEVYLKLYNRISTRRVLYQLVYLSLKCGEIEEAEEFYSEYEELDKSCDRIILRYYIDKAKGADRQKLIAYLQQLKREDYMEEWAYELAKLYHKEGMIEECIQECSDIALWFGEGLIVEKALLLKHHYMDGADISSEKAIMEETRNMAAELRIAAAIAERNEREQAYREAKAAGNEVSFGYEEMADYEETQGYEEMPVYEEELEYTEEPIYEEQTEYVEEPAGYTENSVYEEAVKEEAPIYEKTATYEEIQMQKKVAAYYGAQSLYDEEPEYAEEAMYEEQAEYTEKMAYEKQTEYTEEVHKQSETESLEEEVFEEGASDIEKEIANIVRDIKKERIPGHIAITGEVSDKNIEIGKYLAKELCRQKVLPTSKIARINAERLNDVSIQENQAKLVGGCLLIEEASKLSLDSIQNLYQFIHKTRGEAIVILSDTEEKIEALLKKNRKLGNIIEYHIQI